MDKFNTAQDIGLWLLGAVVALSFIYAGWNYFTTPDRTSDYFSLRAELGASRSDYAKCYNSSNYGSTALDPGFKYGSKYIVADGSNDDLDLFNKTQKDFINKINQVCKPIIDNYEKSYATANEIYELQTRRDSWEDYLFSVFPGRSLPEINEFDPATVRFQDGFALTNFMFTENDVEQAYVEAFGY